MNPIAVGIVVSFILSGVASATCTPTASAPVCAYVSAPTAITVRLIVPAEVKCGELQYRGPTASVFTIKRFRPTGPVADVAFPAPTAGRYDYYVSLQAYSVGSNCPVPYNWPGGGGGNITRP